MKLCLSEAFVAFCVKPLGPKPKDILSDQEGCQRNVIEDVDYVYTTGRAGHLLISQPAPWSGHIQLPCSISPHA